MAVKPIAQRDFSKGLIVVTQTFSQPPGSVPQISNMTFSRRGGLITAGSINAVSAPASNYVASAGAFMDFFYFQPNTVAPYLVALQEQLGAPEHTTLIKLPAGIYSAANVIATFPTSNILSGDLIDIGSPNTPSGGVTGQCAAVSRMLQFANQLVLILGNGQAPNLYPDGGPAVALANNWTSSLPIWIAATPYQLGTYVIASPDVGHIFQCVQAGTSGGSQPAFGTTQGAIYADGSVIWQEVGSDAVVAPRGAAHAINHGGSLWLYNTYPTTTSDLIDGPACLKMSNLNDPNTWNPLNTAHLDKDDGTEGTGLASFAIAEAGIAPSLVLTAFKNYKTFVINGIFGAADFYITRAATDMGCIAPRSIQYIADVGIVRLTHRGVAVFDGIGDQVVSDAIRSYLFQELKSVDYPNSQLLAYAMSAQFSNPPMYLLSIPVPHGTAGPFQRLLLWDILLNAWTVMDLPLGIYGMTQALFPTTSAFQNAGSPLYLGQFAQGASAYQLLPSSQAPSSIPIGGPATAWSFTTPEVFASAPASRTYFRRMFIRGIYWGLATSIPPVTVIVTVSGAGSSVQTTLNANNFNNLAPGQLFEAEVGICLTGLSAHAQISGTDCFEISDVEWHLTPKPPGPPASFMQ
jgi:hypothetical protein